MNNNDNGSQSSLYHVTEDRSSKLRHLVQPAGTVPFAGLRTPVSYPDEIDEDLEDTPRFNTENVSSFVEAIEVLPEAHKVQTFAENMFVEEGEDGTPEVDLEAALNVDGLDYDQIEDVEGKSFEELVEETDTQSVHQLPSRKVVTDKRRQALRLAGWNVKSEWQVASNRYTPLDVNRFYGKKADVCAEENLDNAFGWIRYRDYGGDVTITTIYPSFKHVIGVADDEEVEDERALPEADDDDSDRLTTADNDDNEDKVAFFGDQVRYNFMSKSKLEVIPIVYFPESNSMIPLDMGDDTLVRRQMGSLMDDTEEHHQEVINGLDDKTTEFDEDIMRARKIAVDFTECDFTMSEFYEYLGLDTDKYVEATIERVKQLAENAAQPTIWNLQLGLKRTLIEDYEGDRAGDRYVNFEQIAGQLLRYPKTQVRLAVQSHRRKRQQEKTPEEEREENQVGLGEFDDIMDLEGVTEGQMTPSEAQRVQEHIEERVDS